jgi:LAS superfamily LD-carboxypeptidase LdcB
MLAAAAADGVKLGGFGYRDSANQVRLRQQNCPDPVNSPPSECDPPTAIPGTSMHERGLAIDFTANGQFITSHDNPGYEWLAANAGRFGFENLPSEPWHWSTNGQ